MKDQLIKAMQRNRSVYMMYISKYGVITKKHIQKQIKHTFITNDVLLIIPVVYKERGIINV